LDKLLSLYSPGEKSKGDKNKYKDKKMLTFACEKRIIDSGQFKIEDLKKFSINTSSKIIIPGFAIIESGKIEYIDKRIN
jgi:hypothetical protein